MSEQSCGFVGRRPISEIADRCARAVVDFSHPRAVCLAPDGRVTVEYPRHCVEEDLVGVYSAEAGAFALWQQIDGDLRESARQRGITGAARRHRVSRRGVRKEAA